MSSGGGEQTTEVRINPHMRQGGQQLQGDATDFYNQGTSGIYQGSRLAEFNPYIQQGEDQLLDYWSAGGAGQNMTDNAMASYNQLLGAGDYDNPFLREQIDALTGNAIQSFNRGVAPGLDQGATQAGQFGSSRAGIAEGLARSDMQGQVADATIQALMGGQQLALQANGMLPMMQGAGAGGANAMMGIGNARTQRDQMQLMDEIQQFEAPRNAQLQNMQQYAQLMNSNPLMGEQTQITQGPESDPFAQALGLGLTGAGMFFGGPAGAGLGASLGGMFGGTGVPGLNYAQAGDGGAALGAGGVKSWFM